MKQYRAACGSPEPHRTAKHSLEQPRPTQSRAGQTTIAHEHACQQTQNIEQLSFSWPGLLCWAALGCSTYAAVGCSELFLLFRAALRCSGLAGMHVRGLLWFALGCSKLVWAALGCAWLLCTALGCSGLLCVGLGCSAGLLWAALPTLLWAVLSCSCYFRLLLCAARGLLACMSVTVVVCPGLL